MEENTNKFDIITGEIFEGLDYRQEEYEKSFLKDIKEAVWSILEASDIVTIPFNEEYPNRLIGYREAHQAELKASLMNEDVMNPDYFVKRNKINGHDELVQFYDGPLIEKNNEYFDLFFVARISLINIMEVDNFLDHHLEKTFNGNPKAFEGYLQKISIKYRKIMEQNFDPLIKTFFENVKDNGTTTPEAIKKGKPEFTTARQVLAVHYLLKGLDVKNIDNTEKARFIQFLTGKEVNNVKIKNTNIYKSVCNPLKPNEKGLIEDLQFVRNYFEKLSLLSIVEEINKELKSTK